MPRTSVIICVLLFTVFSLSTGLHKAALKEQALEMFKHAYWSYMNYAYPADELMPLSCKGRYRGVTPTRGDVDDALGNFSLTLIDSLDSLVVLGMYSEFERAVSLVISDVKFDTDVAVSVFETNIRVVGGLLGGHLMAKRLQEKQANRMPWYTDQLLLMATDIASRLLPAFNTTSGVPYPRVNLKRGLTETLKRSHDTCTACGGTMILEFAALSRLTGQSEFEEKARKAMDFLWQQRHRGSDLMGTVLNIHNGDWIRRDSGVGAGIDSYYEYCLKAYILLGDFSYLHRFNKHYEGVMRYISQGPVFVDVHMHKPTVASRSFMDSLLAFWPGLQVLKGDLKPAIETHEMLYQVIQKHNFLPEAFTHDFQVHWGQHPLRPEFVESTYFLYKATKDPHYLDVGEKVIEAMNKHVRTGCGFAGVRDVRTMAHEDRMDSFVLAETFKYLFMLFAEKDDLIFDPDNYIFTTEAHFLPLSIAQSRYGAEPNPPILLSPQEKADAEDESFRSCPNTRWEFKGDLTSYGKLLRNRLKNLVPKTHQQKSCPARGRSGGDRLRAKDFTATNPVHMESLRRMGIQIMSQPDGKVQLIHSANSAATPKDAQDGLVFMQEMIQLSQTQQTEGPQPFRVVQIVSEPYFGLPGFTASPAQFGKDLTGSFKGIQGELVLAEPLRACSGLTNIGAVRGNIVLVERSDCMFVEKASNAEQAGARAIIIFDHFQDTNSAHSPLFAMSGDGKTRVAIPAVFLFRLEGETLREHLEKKHTLNVRIGEKLLNPNYFVTRFLEGPTSYRKSSTCEPFGENEIYISVAPDGSTCVLQGGKKECFTEEDLLAPEVLPVKTLPLMEENQPEAGMPGNNCVRKGSRVRCVERVGNQEIISVEDGDSIYIETRELVIPDDGVCDWGLDFLFGSRRKNAVPNRRQKITSKKPPIIEVVSSPHGQKVLNFHFGPYLPDGNSAELVGDEKQNVLDNLVREVRDQTNVGLLAESAEYLKVVEKMAEMAMGVAVRLSEHEQLLLHELTKSIKLNSATTSTSLFDKDNIPSEKYTHEGITCFYESEGTIRCEDENAAQEIP